MSRPAPSRKHKLEDSESEHEEDSETEEEHHARSAPVSGLVHKKARKSEAEKLAEIPEWAIAEEQEEDLGPRGRASKSGNKFASRSKLTSRQKGGAKPKAEPPNYAPTKDKYGDKVWKGSRSGLTWFKSVTDAMAPSKAGGCQLQSSAGCTGAADAIDHVDDFASVQTGIETSDICDRKNHWKAIMLDTAKFAYNGEFDPNETIKGDELTRLGKTFAWSCTPCNSKKSGVKGLDGGQATWLGACPGDDCEL